MFKVLVTSRNFGATGDDFRYFRDRGYEIVKSPCPERMPLEADLIPIMHDLDAIVIGNDPITPAVLEAAPKLKVVAKMGVGVDNVDIAAATAHGVKVCNVIGTTVNPVSDLTIGLMIALSKRIIQNNRSVVAGGWPVDRGHDITEKTLALIGFGRIGCGVAKRAKGFDMKVIAYDPVPNRKAAEELGVQLVETIDEMLPEADYVSLHIPKTPENVHLIDARRLSLMKPSAYLLNLSRGGIVDEDALYEALTKGSIAGAACDVLETEPPNERLKLFDLDNFIITPHLGGNSVESIKKTAFAAANNVICVLEGLPCENILNP